MGELLKRAGLPMNPLAPNMSLRDYFAGQALTGMLSSLPCSPVKAEQIAAATRSAYRLADAMLDQRRSMTTPTKGPDNG